MIQLLRNTRVEKKYLFLLLVLINFLLTPVHFAFFGTYPALVVVVNFTLVILAGLGICSSRFTRISYFMVAIAGIAVIWLEFSIPEMLWLVLFRQLTSIALFSMLSYMLVKELAVSKNFDLHSIIGALSGFILIGLIGGVLFEFIDTIFPQSFVHDTFDNGYIYYYFSFVSITTVGYGDVTPITPLAQSITLLMNIVGQFYLTIVVALFVGKYLNKS